VDEGDNIKIVRIWHLSFEKFMPAYQHFERGRNNNSSRGPRPPAGQKYLQFVLYKENMDTNAAINQIVRRLSSSRPHQQQQRNLRMGFAGNKDKRGVTSQFVTVPATTPISSLCSWNIKDGGGGHTRNAGASVIRLGNFQYASDELRLGRLQGNRFDVVLRNVQKGMDDKDDDRANQRAQLQAAANAVRERGFINYFGVQRFGKFHDTHHTGIAVLQGDFEKAVDVIMKIKEGEREEATKARELWHQRFAGCNGDRAPAEKGCAAQLLRQFHRSMTAEVAIVQSLARFPLDYKRAFGSIPKTLRMMFIHALQSYLWNAVASHRVQMADDCLEGDLVFTSEGKGQDDGLASVRTLSAQDIASGQYTLLDIVLPLIGTKTRNPENACGDLFDKLLAEQGVTMEMMRNVLDRDLHCAGDYRKLVCRPTDVDCHIVEYTDPLQPLLQTDLMKLNGVQVEAVADSARDTVREKGLLLGLVVGFTLPSSSYATIFLRELMKRPTSSEFQRELKLD
jgi:tRNA pseudouridine13 synthase